MFPNPDYTVRVDNTTDPNKLTIGKAAPASNEADAVWQIRQGILVSGDLTSIKWAEGTNEFDKSWALRGTYGFS